VNAARLTRGKEFLFWPSASSRDWKGAPASRVTPEGYNARLDEAVILYGQAGPVSSNTIGSLRELWATPKQQEDGRTLEAWRRHAKANKRNGSSGGPPAATLSIQIQQWMTPRACEAQNPPMGVDKRHHGLTHQVTKTWATPRGYAQAGPDPNRVNRPTSGGDDLVTQIAKVQSNMIAKLNPRWVETLMGLPIGWTMPSCTSPQTIAPMSCDSSAMELCQPPQSELSEFSLAS
jgi:hypothetical protein